MRLHTIALGALLAISCQKYPVVSATQVGWVHSDGSALRDEYGRQWLYRGINARVSGLFDVTFAGDQQQPDRQPVETIPPFDQSDVQQMAADGFNFLRLPINWSGLEPSEGSFSQPYLDRLSQVIGWCHDAGLYVLVDFHQDAYSKEIGEDGEPLWAIVPAPTMLLGGPLTDLTARRTSTQVIDASGSFFSNTDSLQDRFLPAWNAVVSRFTGEEAIIGYEPMNEPVVDLALDNGDPYLQAFYEKIDTAYRAVDHRHPLWLEPDSLRNQLLSAPLRSTPFPDSNLVYEPHMYPPPGISASTEAGWVSALDGSFDGILNEAKSWGAAPFLGEWGDDPSTSASFPYMDGIEDLLEPRLLGDAFWLWREESQGNWGFFTLNADGSWTLRAAGLQDVQRPYPMAVPGSLRSFHFDRPSATLTVTFDASGNEAAPLLFLPSNWYPNGVSVTLNGRTVKVGTGRVLLPWSGEKGTFTVVTQPAG